jgi:hypothetical protein
MNKFLFIHFYHFIHESNLRRVENSLGNVRQRAAAAHRHNGGMYIGNTPFSAIPNSMNQEQSKNSSYIQNNIVKKIPVLRIRDVYPGSRILIVTQPRSRISDPGSKNSNERQE